MPPVTPPITPKRNNRQTLSRDDTATLAESQSALICGDYTSPHEGECLRHPFHAKSNAIPRLSTRVPSQKIISSSVSHSDRLFRVSECTREREKERLDNSELVVDRGLFRHSGLIWTKRSIQRRYSHEVPHRFCGSWIVVSGPVAGTVDPGTDSHSNCVRATSPGSLQRRRERPQRQCADRHGRRYLRPLLRTNRRLAALAGNAERHRRQQWPLCSSTRRH